MGTTLICISPFRYVRLHTGTLTGPGDFRGKPVQLGIILNFIKPGSLNNLLFNRLFVMNVPEISFLDHLLKHLIK